MTDSLLELVGSRGDNELDCKAEWLTDATLFDWGFTCGGAIVLWRLLGSPGTTFRDESLYEDRRGCLGGSGKLGGLLGRRTNDVLLLNAWPWFRRDLTWFEGALCDELEYLFKAKESCTFWCCGRYIALGAGLLRLGLDFWFTTKSAKCWSTLSDFRFNESIIQLYRSSFETLIASLQSDTASRQFL